MSVGVAVTVSVREHADLPPGLAARRWWQISAALAPQDLLRRAPDAQWAVSWVLAESDGAVVGLLPMWRSIRPRFASGLFDPRQVAPEIFGSGGDARDYLLIGGAADLVAGYSVARQLTGAERHRVGTALVGRAFAEAGERGLRGASLYVREAQLDSFVGAGAGGRRAACAVDEFAELAVPDQGIEAYLRGLSSGRRSTVRRDLDGLRRRELRSRTVPAADAITESAGLVAAVKARHGIPDHPRLAAMRLTGWAGAALGRRLAFTVRDPGGELLAVSFGCRHGDVLELYEIGLAESAHRHYAYVEALVYAPLRFAIENGCRLLQLGLGSSRPKMLRGATLSSVWAVGGDAGGDR
jgi:hypothetical protein